MGRYYRFEVSLCDVTPRIWREFEIAADASFAMLHEAIQDACGWANSHLFRFATEAGKVLAELPGDEFDETGPDALKTPIAPFFGARKGKRCRYIYDFGDYWVHELQVIHVFESTDEFGRKLTGGERAFPPEDCGGVQGYLECAEVATGKVKDPQRREWFGGWKPEEFPFKKVAKRYYQARLSLRGEYGGDAGVF